MVEPKLQFRVIFGNDFPINLKQGKQRVFTYPFDFTSCAGHLAPMQLFRRLFAGFFGWHTHARCQGIALGFTISELPGLLRGDIITVARTYICQ
jgi:hypothetical protein